MYTLKMPMKVVMALAVGVVFVGFVAFTVYAGTGIGTTVTMLSPVTVGETGSSASIQFVNTSTAPDNVDTVTISSITLSTTAGNTGVFALSGAGTEAGGTSCGSAAFTITPGVPGTWTISPDVVLQPVGVNGTCVIDFTLDVLEFPAVDDGGAVGTQAFLSVAGNALNNVTFTPGNAAGTGQTTVNLATPTIDTTPDPEIADVGEMLNDNVTLLGGFHPTGTITFNLFEQGDDTCQGPVAYTEVVAVAGNGGYGTAPGFASDAAGTWRWTADYSGDANNDPASSGCDEELVTVNKLDSNTVTEVHDQGHSDITNGSVFEGTAVHDWAKVTGGGPVPTGNVDFTLFDNLTCNGQIVDEWLDVALDGSGEAESPAMTFAVGVYSYLVHYDGDGVYNPSDAECEPFTIDPVLPLVVEKTVNTSFDRDWDWSILKEGDDDELILQNGEVMPVHYTITLTPSSEDINHMVWGVITVTNPLGNPDATVEDVTDVLDVSGATSVDCSADVDFINFPHILAAGEDLDCTYLQTSASLNDTQNTATAETSGLVSGNFAVEPVVYNPDPSNEYDTCVIVDDDNPNGPQGVQICEGDADKTIEYDVTFGFEAEVPAVCDDDFNHLNTASFVTSTDDDENDDTGSDDWTVHVVMDCFEGCTLTQGYWKTHNESFHGGAPADPNWGNVGDWDEDAAFELEQEGFLTADGFTWFDSFWTPVKGRVWYQLAHQWMAAWLNSATGASTPVEVQTALDEGLVWLNGNDPDAKLKGGAAKEARDLASTLGMYNEGLIGPGHCDENEI